MVDRVTTKRMFTHMINMMEQHNTMTISCGDPMMELLKDVRELLKEQEAVEPYQHDAVWLCGNCEKEVVGWDDDIDGKEYRYPFCRKCGRSVKWE